MNHVPTVNKYISKCGLSVIPVGANKIPIGAWKPFQAKPMNEKQVEKHFGANGVAIGIVCGAVSGNLEVIDVDCKYDLTGKLFEQYLDRIPPTLSQRLVVQKTPSGGYHLLYRCKKIEGNKKLAEREATAQEKESGEKIKVLIETRGEGGYIAAYPTKGYEVIQNHFHEIPEITEAERDEILNAARSLNQHIKPELIVFNPNPKEGEESVFKDYNEKSDVVALLTNHGWTPVKDTGDKVLMRRPGKHEGHSAEYSRSKKWFTVFSSSTEFDQLKAYQPYAVFTVLECGGDFSEAAKRLREQGYGAPIFKSTSIKIKENVSEYITGDEDLEYLIAAKEKKLPMGLTTGIPVLDFHWRFKRGNFIVINGHDNTGKSVCMWFLAVLSVMLHKWKWIIYSGENKSGYVKRKLIEFKYCKPIEDLTEQEVKSGYKWTQEHFTLISNNDLYTYKHILTIAEGVMQKRPCDAMLIDPYNSLYIDMDSFSKMSTHDYHYYACSEIRLFCKKHDCSVFLNCHAVTEALRRVYPKGHRYEGYPMPPNKADTEGGGKFSNRADDFITIHRMTQHPDEWKYTEFHVRKIKETETGGHPTPLEFPVKLKMIQGNCGFEDVEAFNPVLNKFSSSFTRLRDFTEPQKEELPI